MATTTDSPKKYVHAQMANLHGRRSSHPTREPTMQLGAGTCVRLRNSLEHSRNTVIIADSLSPPPPRQRSTPALPM